METIRRLITRLRRAGILLVISLILIGYISLGILYWQQDTQQTNLEQQIAKITPVLARPVPSIEPLKADYDNVTDELALVKVNDVLASMADEHTPFVLLVSIAEKSGITTDESVGKLSIPPPTLTSTRVGGDTFQLWSFRNMRVQGNNDNVTAFLIDLDSGKTRETMVLKRVMLSYLEMPFTAEELEQRAELNMVTSAIKAMMADNRLWWIPHPMSFAFGRATNLMGDNITTTETVEGFPDITSTLFEKGYTGAGSPRNGYVLYQHDQISTDNTSQFETVSYVTMLATKYYYTAEEDGVIRQFSGPILATAEEYLSSKGMRTETIATVDVDIYFKNK